MENDKISVVVPCYNERKALPHFYEAIQKIAKMREDLIFEFVFIDDGSRDGTALYLKDIASKDDRVVYVSFSRNFGKEAAMYAGLQHATGDYVAIMDADMQDPPELLPKMYDMIQEEACDSIATRRSDRKGEPVIRSFFSKMFYKVIGKISETNVVDGARDFRLMKRKMVDSILEMGEYNRFTKGIFDWVGFETKWISFENVERVAGETKWSFWKLVKYSIDGIVNFSTIPLRISSVMGLLLCIVALCFILFVAVRKMIFGDPVNGWASLVCVVLFIGGVQLFCMGIMGKYLACTYMETKRRPLYIVKDSNFHGQAHK